MNAIAVTTLGQLNTATVDVLEARDQLEEAYRAFSDLPYLPLSAATRILRAHFQDRRERLAALLARAHAIRTILEQLRVPTEVYGLAIHQLADAAACLDRWVVRD